MTRKINRREAMVTCAASSGLLYTLSMPKPAQAIALPDVWGQDYLTQWSPRPDFKPEVKPGTVPIRLSCASYRLRYSKDTPVEQRVKAIRDAGYTACESGDDWKQATDSEIGELKAALKKYDLWYYAIHVFTNNIHPDISVREKNNRRTIEAIEAAERLGLDFIVSHTGSCDAVANYPHRDNWTKETWDLSVNVMKQILKDTAGCKVNLGIEALNPTNINNPQAHVRLKEDVGDDRIKVTFDPQNMIHPGVYYRMTEVLHECFELLGEDICYAHLKDLKWMPAMEPVFEWVVPGEGGQDFETYLLLLSNMKYTRPCLLEFLSREEYPAAKKHIEDTAAKVGVKIYK